MRSMLGEWRGRSANAAPRRGSGRVYAGIDLDTGRPDTATLRGSRADAERGLANMIAEVRAGPRRSADPRLAERQPLPQTTIARLRPRR